MPPQHHSEGGAQQRASPRSPLRRVVRHPCRPRQAQSAPAQLRVLRLAGLCRRVPCVAAAATTSWDVCRSRSPRRLRCCCCCCAAVPAAAPCSTNASSEVVCDGEVGLGCGWVGEWCEDSRQQTTEEGPARKVSKLATCGLETDRHAAALTKEEETQHYGFALKAQA